MPYYNKMIDWLIDWLSNNNTNKQTQQLRCTETWMPHDVAPFVLRCFCTHLYKYCACACLQTAISKLPINILTPPLNLATLISYYYTNNSAIGGHLRAFLDICLPRMRRNCYLQACGQTFDINIRFSDPDFLKESNIWRSDDVFGDFFHCTDKNVLCVNFRFIWPKDFEHVSQPIRNLSVSWRITFLLLIRNARCVLDL